MCVGEVEEGGVCWDDGYGGSGSGSVVVVGMDGDEWGRSGSDIGGAVCGEAAVAVEEVSE